MRRVYECNEVDEVGSELSCEKSRAHASTEAHELLRVLHSTRRKDVETEAKSAFAYCVAIQSRHEIS